MNPDVAVIGGGAIGLSVAHRLARDGSSVTVFDPTPGTGASAIAAGMLAPVTELHYGEDPLLRLNQLSARMFGEWIRDLEASTGLETGFRSTGTLMVARDADENAELRTVVTHQESLDLKVERLRGSEARRLEPGLATGVRGAVLVPDDHQVDPAALAIALLAACRQAGVTFVQDRVVEVLLEEERVAGVATTETRFSCDVAVVSAGCWSGQIGGLPNELSGAIRPVKGQLIELRSRDGAALLQRNVRGRDVYLVPRADGRLVVGATVEEMGFDTSVTGGAVHELLRDAYEIVPGVAEMEFLRARAGLRPGTPDNAPLLGPVGPRGLIAATGHYRNGILLAPVTADVIAEVLSSGRLPDRAAAFAPGRFS